MALYNYLHFKDKKIHKMHFSLLVVAVFEHIYWST